MKLIRSYIMAIFGLLVIIHSLTGCGAASYMSHSMECDNWWLIHSSPHAILDGKHHCNASCPPQPEGCGQEQNSTSSTGMPFPNRASQRPFGESNMNNNRTSRRVPNWDNIFTAIAILVLICFVAFGGCATDSRIEADYEDHVAGCTAAYGEGNDTQCIENVNARFNR